MMTGSALQEDIARSARYFFARGHDILGTVPDAALIASHESKTPILCPERLRRVPRQFSWIDQRLVRDRHVTRCRYEALALYLPLVTVADARGSSYYSDTVPARLLSLSVHELREAPAQLIATGLIAYQAPFYQVLSLDPQQGVGLRRHCRARPKRSRSPRSSDG